MTVEEAAEIINRIVLIGGRVSARPHAAMSMWINIRVSIRVFDRVTKEPIFVGLSRILDVYPTMNEDHILQLVQGLWTSLQMHESLETIILDGKLPFDPHCQNSIPPRYGEFLRDDECTLDSDMDLGVSGQTRGTPPI